MKEEVILHIETATEVCSVALSNSGVMIALEEIDEPNAHSREITLLIEQCFQKTGLNLENIAAVSVSAGPGSYTGLRVGVSTAKGICYSLNKPLLVVETLKTMAWACREQEPDALYVPMIDARRMEVYLAAYNAKLQVVQATEAHVLSHGSLDGIMAAAGNSPIIVCGNGAEKAKESLKEGAVKYSSVRCSAAHQAGLAWTAYQQKIFADLVVFEPEYLKAPNITSPKQHKF